MDHRPLVESDPVLGKAKKSPAPRSVGVYQLGESIGKGAYGVVYKGLNIQNGDFVAIKQMSLHNVPKEEFEGIMMEIKLLKNLKAENIVKYYDYCQKGKDLYIIMEYLENGSLQSVVKKFGSLPESVVAIYIEQVLRGLEYLHSEGVIHRDIKGANILITKEGKVKLADFGVATKLDAEVEDPTVVGTPYWMAPEVIEMSGPSTAASDIWSVGCTIVELITGYPPYFHLEPMPALFRIVQDEIPLPDNISPALRDFLVSVFQKDPNLRVGTDRLLKHPWLQTARRALQPQSQPSIPDQPGSGVIQQTINTYRDSVRDLSSMPSAKQKQPEKKTSILSSISDTLGITSSSDKDKDKDKKKGGKPAFDPSKYQEDEDEDFNDLSLDNINVKVDKVQRTSVTKTPLLVRHEDVSALLHSMGSNLTSTASKFNKYEETDEDYDDLLEDAFDNFDDDDDPKAKKSDPVKPDDFHNKLQSIMKQSWDESHEDQYDLFTLGVDEGMDMEVKATAATNRNLEQEVLKLIAVLQPNEEEDAILQACQKLVELFKTYPALKKYLIANHGVIPIMEMLQVAKPQLLHAILQVVNSIIHNNKEFQENLCLVGIIPVITKFAGRGSPKPLRLEASHFVREMCHSSTLTMQMFISCQGLPVLVDFLEPELEENRDLIYTALDGISRVFILQTPTPRNDFCHLFAKFGVVPRLVQMMRALNAEVCNDVVHGYLDKIANVFILLSASDTRVKKMICTDANLQGLVPQLDQLPKPILAKVLKAIKQLSNDPDTLDALQRAGCIPKLVAYLSMPSGQHTNDIRNQTFHALFNLCKVHKPRQELAAVSGIIPHCQSFIKDNSLLRQFALQIFCDLARASRRSRSELSKYNAVESYLQMLKLPAYWQHKALDSLAHWLVDDQKNVQEILGRPGNVKILIECFKDATQQAFVNNLEPFQRILNYAWSVNIALGSKQYKFTPLLIERMQHPNAGARYNLVKMLHLLYEFHPQPKQFIAENKLIQFIKKQATNDSSVMVREMCNQLLAAFSANVVI
eukprot:GFYU01004243.1.p1 GENE.GFYU01004243.1~~GFYU01004243.1.p1  ORF type:complete len:1033 (+),score=320.77 GFYU01004243.1:301-3399(+)